MPPVTQEPVSMAAAQPTLVPGAGCIGARGETFTGTGVQGTSFGAGHGVLGQSKSSRGVGGISESDIGVFGVSTSGHGVLGQSKSSRGVGDTPGHWP